MNVLVLVTNTVREVFAKATLLFLAGLSTVILLGLALSLGFQTGDDGTTLLLLGQPTGPPVPAERIAELVAVFQMSLAGGLMTGMLLFGVFATAGIVPDMLEKGIVDLYLSKPLARWQLLLGKYLGAVFVMLLNAVYFTLGLWLIFGFKAAVWSPALLLSSLEITFIFGALYALVLFFGVISRNMAIAIIGGYLYLFIVGGLLEYRETGLYRMSENVVYRRIVDGFYYLLPQLSAMQQQLTQQILQKQTNWMPFVQSLLSSALIFCAGALALRRKDF
jgi:ABC-type transport system involved in multi-copper enzyme maturation permease subunit